MFFKELRRIFLHIRWSLQVFTVLGFFFALVISRINFSFLVILTFFSSLFLGFGITLFNSYYDKDEKPVAGLKNPPQVTKSLFFGSLFFKIFSLLLAFFVNKLFFLLTFLAVLLSIIYSHKDFRFKSNGFVALFFNFLAGFITFFSVSSIGFPELIASNIIFGALSSGFFLMSVYLMMQIHQINDDKLRGDNSYAVIFGRNNAIIASIVVLIIAGFFALLSLYYSNLFFDIFILSAYMLIGLILVNFWLFKKNYDFSAMSIITNYLSFIGSIILILLYFFKK